jgi:hypothetical protein
MPNFGYHLARLQGKLIRESYRKLLRTIVRSPLCVARSVPLDVFSYSGESALPEQVVSIRSFLRYLGRPRAFTVVSDGTYSRESIELLRAIDPSVQVSDTHHWLPKDVREEARTYLTKHPTGRQLALIMSLPVAGPALYIDSDVRFFAGACALLESLQEKASPAYYLGDCMLSADERIFRGQIEKAEPVNTGFLLLFKKLDWSLSVDRFLQLEGAPTFFTNQTMAHLTMHQNGAKAFNPAQYVIQLDDQFVFGDRYASSQIVMRHYVQPVRHKLWSSLFV